jgi:hypothetical protein
MSLRKYTHHIRKYLIDIAVPGPCTATLAVMPKRTGFEFCIHAITSSMLNPEFTLFAVTGDPFVPIDQYLLNIVPSGLHF